MNDQSHTVSVSSYVSSGPSSSGDKTAYQSGRWYMSSWSTVLMLSEVSDRHSLDMFTQIAVAFEYTGPPSQISQHTQRCQRQRRRVGGGELSMAQCPSFSDPPRSLHLHVCFVFVFEVRRLLAQANVVR